MSSVSLACMSGVVSRCLVLFKFKGIMAFPVEKEKQVRDPRQPLGIPVPQNILAAPTGSSGHSRGLRRSQHSARWRPHCRCSTRGAALPQPQAWGPEPGPSGSREEWGK